MKKIILKLAFLTLSLFCVLALINVYIVMQSNKYVFKEIDDLPQKQAITVLGAYVHGDNLSSVLEDRVNAGIDIYNAEKSVKILLSGDHGQTNYDEVNSMRKYVIAHDEQILPENIFMDHAGFDTYDSMYRAKEIFQIDSAIIVTQDFHINRAVYIARSLGIDAVGYSVSEDNYKDRIRLKWRLREFLSRIKAFSDVVMNAQPKYLGEPIPITGDSRLSWDEDE